VSQGSTMNIYNVAYRDDSNFSKHLQFLLIPDLQYPPDEAILPGIKLDTVQQLFKMYQIAKAVEITF
jgi:hypothetical protein